MIQDEKTKHSWQTTVDVAIEHGYSSIPEYSIPSSALNHCMQYLERRATGVGVHACVPRALQNQNLSCEPLLGCTP